MDFKAIDLTLNHFNIEDKVLLADLLANTQQQRFPVLNNISAEQVSALLGAHKAEHGTGIGFIKDGYEDVLGFAGLHYLADVELYETVCQLQPEFADRANYVIEYLVYEAFSNLGLDKVCARALPGHTDEVVLKENGFVCLGERVFAEEGLETIWNYYELENEANMTSAEERNSYATSDWDSIF
ncbi:MAG: hypothetical protein KDC07_05240 [Chitinophagaceae bacterium]|nr:hypothetical protein [Chitinophagaceae bacterium]MCB9046887.1 hypothetical protein [Chitinophagales bacterium]